MNTQKYRQNDEKSAAKKLPKNTAVLGAKTACKNRAKLRVSVAMANISMLYSTIYCDSIANFGRRRVLKPRKGIGLFMENERERDVIAGRNAVTEALKAGRPIDSILVRRGEKNGSVSSILRMAKQAGIPVKEVDSRKLDGMCGGENHQGVIAMAAVHAFSEVEDIFALAESRNEPPFILVCDEIADPHNLGAILRTAECAGAHGVVIPKRRSVGLTAAVGKASAGAVEYVPVARVTNIAVFLEEIKARGVWVYAADMDGTDWCQTDFSGPAALVVGSEGFGVSRLVKEKSDFIVSLPMKGRINSLNASVACGVLCYEIARQRAGIKAKG